MSRASLDIGRVRITLGRGLNAVHYSLEALTAQHETAGWLGCGDGRRWIADGANESWGGKPST